MKPRASMPAHRVDAAPGERRRERAGSEPERIRLAEERGEVTVDDAGLREVGNGPDPGLQSVHGRRAGCRVETASRKGAYSRRSRGQFTSALAMLPGMSFAQRSCTPRL